MPQYTHSTARTIDQGEKNADRGRQQEDSIDYTHLLMEMANRQQREHPELRVFSSN